MVELDTVVHRCKDAHRSIVVLTTSSALNVLILCLSLAALSSFWLSRGYRLPLDFSSGVLPTDS